MIKNIGIKKCPKCGESLKFKSFNPYIKLMFGVFILGLSIATVALSQSPVIWIGGFIWGGYMIYASFENWEEIKKLDKFY
ncbi:MAG TPA: hypothetical protein VK153_02380 [Candidatus Paceibacterota bacterium]|nr:hypothetical protein [Candidatus Paceibacterota bacterium]